MRKLSVDFSFQVDYNINMVKLKGKEERCEE